MVFARQPIGGPSIFFLITLILGICKRTQSAGNGRRGVQLPIRPKIDLAWFSSAEPGQLFLVSTGVLYFVVFLDCRCVLCSLPGSGRVVDACIGGRQFITLDLTPVGHVFPGRLTSFSAGRPGASSRSVIILQAVHCVSGLERLGMCIDSHWLAKSFQLIASKPPVAGLRVAAGA